eukprot:366199-Chlamydomonas_euryale.AAC.14
MKRRYKPIQYLALFAHSCRSYAQQERIGPVAHDDMVDRKVREFDKECEETQGEGYSRDGGEDRTTTVT